MQTYTAKASQPNTRNEHSVIHCYHVVLVLERKRIKHELKINLIWWNCIVICDQC